MKTTRSAITLNGTLFTKEMARGTFTAFTLYKSGKQVHLTATNAEGTVFVRGTSAGVPRFWTEISSPISFLENSGVTDFNVVLEKESA